MTLRAHPTEGQRQAWALVQSGKSFRQAARELGVSKGTIQQRIEAMRRRRRLLSGTVYGIVLVAALWLNAAFAEFDPGVEQWRGAVDEACVVMGCSTDYILSVMACESGGDPTAVGPNGELGIMQIDPAIWGQMSSVEEIWFAAAHLGNDIFWVCA